MEMVQLTPLRRSAP